MAVIDFKMVYRDGAALSSPVTSFKLADTVAELVGGVEGDLAYAKNTDLVYVYNGTTWMSVGNPAFNGGTITNDLEVYKVIPRFMINDSRGTTRSRVFAAVNDRLDVSVNYNFTGAVWVKDDATKKGFLITFDIGQYPFYVQGNSLEALFNVDYAGNLAASGSITQGGHSYEYYRTIPSGVWQDVPYSSGNFTSSGGQWLVESGDIASYKYMFIGKTMWVNFVATQTSVIHAGALAVRIPNGLTANGYFTNMAWFYDGAAGWTQGTVIAQNGSPWITTQLAGFAAFPVTTNNTYMYFQIAFGIA